MLYHKKIFIYILYDYSIINEEEENIKKKRTKI